MPNKQAMSNYWAFLADPSRYRIEEAVRELKTDTWVTKGRPLMAGDKILIWKSAGKDGKRGVIALGEVLTDPQMLSDSENLFWVTPPDADNTEERVQVRYVLWPGLPLWLNEHDALNSLSISRARGGTVFRVTPEQYQAVTTAAGGLPEGATVLEPLFTDHDGSAPRNPAWSREELMLALDLFFQLKPAHISKDHPEIIALSQLLNALPIHTDRPDVPRFRNPKGVSMKLSNFLRLDPTYLGVRLEREGKMEETIWDEFAKDRDRLHLLAEAIRAGLTMTAEELLALPPPDEDFEAPEGRLLLRVHKYKERNPSLV